MAAAAASMHSMSCCDGDHIAYVLRVTYINLIRCMYFLHCLVFHLVNSSLGTDCWKMVSLKTYLNYVKENDRRLKQN